MTSEMLTPAAAARTLTISRCWAEVELDQADPTLNAAAAVLADPERVVRRRRRNGGWGGHLRGVTVVGTSQDHTVWVTAALRLGPEP